MDHGDALSRVSDSERAAPFKRSKIQRLPSIEASPDPNPMSQSQAGCFEIALLCDYRSDIAATVKDHIDSLARFSRHHVRRISVYGSLPRRLDLSRFDVVIVHYSLFVWHESGLSQEARLQIARFDGLKAVLIQDEYRHVDRTVAALRQIGADLLFTCVPTDEIEKVYPTDRLPGVRIINTLTGFVPERLLERAVLPYAARPIDVGYRARTVPAWLGELGQEKWRIGHRFLADAKSYGLVCDIAYREEDRLYDEAWTNFVGNCKAVLGVESGASVFDFTGEIQAKVDAHVLRKPDATFDELKALYFADAEGNIRLNQISPRCFEAAALRTLMVNYPGAYSGLLTPHRHYIVLEKDHSNMADVVSILRDTPRCQEIVDRAYREVALNPSNTFRAFVGYFDEEIAGSFKLSMARRSPAYGDDTEFLSAIRPDFQTRRRRFQRETIDRLHRLIFGTLLRFLPDKSVRRIKAVAKRALRLFSVKRGRRSSGSSAHQ